VKKKGRTMNPLIWLKQITSVFLVAFGLICFGLSPIMRAVSPPPDGGYAGGNTAEGQAALLSLTTGGYNTAVGYLSLRSDTTGSFNTAIGAGALLANIGNQNTATGVGALLSDSSGESNTANGAVALFSNTTGDSNNAFGHSALFHNVSGSMNTAIGEYALLNHSAGDGNIALGVLAGWQQNTGSNNIYIGSVGTDEDSTIRIGSGQTATYIAGISSQVASGGVTVFINSDGRLGTLTSSARFKTEIKPMDNSSEVILALKPITFRYKHEIDPKGIPQFGLVAEDVEKVNADLVVHDKEGKPYSVRYDQVNAMLLNEFLKEHRKVEAQTREIEEQKSTINGLRKGLDTVVAQLKEQASQIQKVSSQLELSKGAGRTVADEE
jgi:hypothetical protein